MNNYNNTLQTNNINLQNILTAINNLPEAGTSGGGIETCTVTFAEPQSPFISVPSMDIVIYIDKDEIVVTQQWIPGETVLTIRKGTFIVIYNWINTSGIIPNNAVELFRGDSKAYRIDGDVVFVYE